MSKFRIETNEQHQFFIPGIITTDPDFELPADFHILTAEPGETHKYIKQQILSELNQAYKDKWLKCRPRDMIIMSDTAIIFTEAEAAGNPRHILFEEQKYLVLKDKILPIQTKSPRYGY